MDKNQTWKYVMQAAKIGFGSAFAMFLAHTLGLKFASSAGSITLLTILTTKWETVKLSMFRIVTFGITVFLSFITLYLFSSDWFAYGCFLMAVTLICDSLSWRSALSVNAVIGMHFLETLDFSLASIGNELCLLLIGITIAFVLNLFSNNGHRKKDIVNWMRETEKNLQLILGQLAAYLAGRELQRDVWKDLDDLEKQIQYYIGEANEYQGNTFQSHPGYYIDYFEMRWKQCSVLANLHTEIMRIHTMLGERAKLVSEFLLETANYVVEKNVPSKQLDDLKVLHETLRQGDPPTSAQEFEDQAMIYHIVIDMEEFLQYKQSFIDGLDDEQRKRYWEAE